MRIAFIGTGAVADSHAKAMLKRDDVKVVGACSAHVERAAAFAARYGGKPFGSVVDMLDDTRPDAAWVCVPPYAHGEPELALLERRVPFMVEKPVATSMATAQRILDVVERTGTMVAAGYMNRYRRGVNRAKELLAHDPAILVHGGWIIGYTGAPHWWGVRAQSGGQIVEQSTHTFDLVRYLVGEPLTVFARPARGFVKDLPDCDIDDGSVVAVQFAHGAVGSLVSCAASRAGGGVFLTVAALQHHIQFNGWEHSVLIQGTGDQESIPGEKDIFELEDASFIEAVSHGDGRRISSPYADAVKTLAFCLAANESLCSGLPAEVSSFLPS